MTADSLQYLKKRSNFPEKEVWNVQQPRFLILYIERKETVAAYFVRRSQITEQMTFFSYCNLFPRNNA